MSSSAEDTDRGSRHRQRTDPAGTSWGLKATPEVKCLIGRSLLSCSHHYFCWTSDFMTKQVLWRPAPLASKECVSRPLGPFQFAETRVAGRLSGPRQQKKIPNGPAAITNASRIYKDLVWASISGIPVEKNNSICHLWTGPVLLPLPPWLWGWRLELLLPPHKLPGPLI